MISTTIRLQMDKDGTYKFPQGLLQELGIEPPPEIEVTMLIPSEKIKRMPKKLDAKERAKFDEALRLLRESMKGVDVRDALRHIREGRQDRWF